MSLHRNKHPRWKGDSVSYTGAHFRVYRERGQPSECEKCGTSDSSKRYEWANLTGNYADPQDYIRLCTKCHVIMDRGGKSKNPSRDVEIVRMYLSGKTATDIASAMSMTRVGVARVIRFFRVNGGSIPNRISRLSESEIATIKQMLRMGRTIYFISKTVGRSAWAVNKVAKEIVRWE